MSKGDSTPVSTERRSPSDPILLAGWPESAVDTVETVLSDFQPAVINREPEISELNPFRARIRRLSFSPELDVLEQAVALNDRSLVVLCLSDVQYFLAEELVDKAFPSGSEGEWLNAISASLRIQERDPQRIVIVLAEDALRCPARFAEVLSAHVGYQLSTSREFHSASFDRWRTLYQRLAVFRVAEDEELSRRSAELRSRRLFTAPQLESGTEWLAIYHEIESLRTENGELVDLAHRLQWQLEEKVLESLSDADQIAELQSQLGIAKDKYSELEAALADRKAALQRIRSSTSWRVTKPLRSAVNLIRRANR